MLKDAELTEALHAALKACTPACGRFCVAGAEIVDDKHYRIWHNGVRNLEGSGGSDQTVYSDKVLGLSEPILAAKLKTWIEGLHRGERTDLNAAMATGGPVEGAYLVGSRGPELFIPYADGKIIPNAVLVSTGPDTQEWRGPAALGWPWPPSLDLAEIRRVRIAAQKAADSISALDAAGWPTGGTLP